MMNLPKCLLLGLALIAAPAGVIAQTQAASPPPTAVAGTPAVAPAPVPHVDPPAPPPTAGPVASQGPAATQPTNPAPAFPQIAPDPHIGRPDGRIGLQDQVTDIGKDAAYFHDVWLIPIITAISLLVLGLLLFVILRFRRSKNPVPSRTSHNTVIEVIWTVVPVAALVAIAFPSLGLLARQYAPPKADLTVKVIGNQWYWTYQYPDNGGFEVVSNILKERGDPSLTPGQRYRKDIDGPRLLAADERMVVPVNAVVKVIVTSADVIHSFGMPAFWQKMDAVPGRLNETWFKADREGVYFGQCSELCGARHAYMPIAIDVVSPARFAAWIASKGGTMPGKGPARPDSTAASPITNPSVGAGAPALTPGSATQTSPPPSNVLDAVEKPAVSTQGATDSRRGGNQ